MSSCALTPAPFFSCYPPSSLPTPTLSPQDLLAQGREATQARDYAAAQAAYERATSVDPSSFIAHSNLAITLLHLKRYEDALRAAEAAIRLDTTKPKAVASKGAALLHLNRLDAAEEAYRAVLALDPSHTNAKESLREIQARREQREQREQREREMRDRAAQHQIPTTAPRATRAPSPASISPSGGASSLLHTLTSVGHVAILLFSILYALPLGDTSYASFRAALVACVITHSLVLVERHGRPRADMAYLQSVMQDATLPPVFLALAFMGSQRPVVLALPAVALVDYFLAGEWVQSVSGSLPITRNILSRAGSSLSSAILQRPSDAVARMRADEFRLAVFGRLLYLEALFEVLTAILLLVEMATPYRAILPTVMVWQSLQHRYLISPYSQQAFGTVDGQILGLTRHRMCPAVVGKGYGALRNFLYGRVVASLESARNQAQGRAGGGGAGAGAGAAGAAGGLGNMLSGCTVM